MRAAVAWEAGKPLEIVEMTLPEVGPRQVRVRMAASGVCHSDASVRDGHMPHPLPAVLGHEGAGIVEEVGEGVTRVRPGDHVVLTSVAPCRVCVACLSGQPFLCDHGLVDMFSLPPRTTADGRSVMGGFGIATFGEETLAIERSVVPIDPDIPLEVAALVGCAVTTGVGAVLNTAQVRAGQSVAVVGCGGVGLSVIQGARLAGAAPIVAVDLSGERLTLASDLGATATVDAAGDSVASVRDLTGGRGADHVFEVVGRSATIRDAFSMTRRGGTLTVVGAGSPDDEVRFNAMELFFDAKTILGCMYGSADPERDFPRFLSLYRAGRLDLDRLVTRRIRLDEVNDAFAAMEAGEGARSVIVY
jgi:S-(hydroxymethyl)glutathione dehydrogenase/alcohol dehydrogenase